MANKYFIERETHNREAEYELYENGNYVETVYDYDGNGFRKIRDDGYVRAYTRADVEKVREEYEYYKNRLAEMENGLIVEEE